jgi:hypothetical protein
MKSDFSVFSPLCNNPTFLLYFDWCFVYIVMEVVDVLRGTKQKRHRDGYVFSLVCEFLHTAR